MTIITNCYFDEIEEMATKWPFFDSYQTNTFLDSDVLCYDSLVVKNRDGLFENQEMHTMLHNPKYRGSKREFCGPTAMAAVTGATMDEVRDAIRQERGPERKSDGSYMPIMGLTNVELLGAMENLGWKVVDEDKWKDRAELTRAKLCTLGEFAESHGHGGPYIVNVTGHYVAIGFDEFCDTRSIMCTDLDRAMKWKGMAGKWVKNWWKFAEF